MPKPQSRRAATRTADPHLAPQAGEAAVYCAESPCTRVAVPLGNKPRACGASVMLPCTLNEHTRDPGLRLSAHGAWKLSYSRSSSS
eukprot:scaffold17833_cov112-Isochrysis_galbana.AAC.3